ncbi:MAG TPA: PTS sugar transporter subunit IIA [Acidobacteriota bacterium]|nr:PTS sugar transporter subunit IIA [Acidobacteriota bacterium]
MTENARIGALVVTHGKLGHELVAAAEMIVGDLSWIEAISIGWHEDVNESKEAIEKGARSVDQGKGVLILTDMFGGTPSNLSLALLEKGRVEIVTGVNLPMIIKLAGQSGQESVSELARRLKDQGQSHISIASELLGE